MANVKWRNKIKAKLKKGFYKKKIKVHAKDNLSEIKTALKDLENIKKGIKKYVILNRKLLKLQDYLVKNDEKKDKNLKHFKKVERKFAKIYDMRHKLFWKIFVKLQHVEWEIDYEGFNNNLFKKLKSYDKLIAAEIKYAKNASSSAENVVMSFGGCLKNTKPLSCLKKRGFYTKFKKLNKLTRKLASINSKLVTR